jgi:PAS domain S-box-containing protein
MTGRRIQVLLVEDDPGDARLIREHLADAGVARFEMETIHKLADALERCSRPGIDVVLLDLGLPDSGGLDTLKAFRSRVPDLPIVVLTGLVDEKTAAQAMEIGAQDYLIKGEPGGALLARTLRYSIERKRADQALRRNQAMLARTESIAHVGSWEWDVATDTVTWSDELFRIFQRNPADGAPSFANHTELFFPEGVQRLTEAVEAAVGHGTPFELELRAIRKDGATRVCLARGHAEMGPGKRATRLFGSLQDITERKLAEEALRNSELLLKTILDALPSRIVLQSPDLRILWPNLAACSLSGLPRAQLVGKLCFETWHSQPTVCTDCPLQEALRTGAHRESTVEWGGRTWRVIGCPVRDEGGTITSAVEISEDITERLAREEALRHVQKMESLGTLAGGIAHDFNNILSVIIGYAELAREEAAAHPVVTAHLTEVAGAAMRARSLVGQILAFSRQTKTEIAPTQIHLLVKEAVRMLRATLPATIEIRQEISTFALAMVDPTQVHQVILNLGTNAFHAMRDTGGLLSIELADTTLEAADCLTHPELKPGPYLRLRVSDTGIGMDEATRLRAFEPYFTTKQQGEGTGLGLAISYGIIRIHNGAISVDSVPNGGSTFTVLLPKVEKGEPAGVSDTRESAPGGREPILLVDDEPALLALARQALGRLGYTVTTCGNGLEALELFRATPDRFDVVVTDMTMPGLTGDRLARELTAIRPGTPVIITTGFSEHLDAEKALAQGVRAFLMKPFPMSQLAQTVRDVLDEGNKGLERTPVRHEQAG